MSSITVGQRERATQNRVVRLFYTELGYEYLGNWEKAPRTAPIEDEGLRKHLLGRGYAPAIIERAIRQVHLLAENQSETLYRRNRAVYQALRYGIKVKPEAGALHETVYLVEWADPAANHFGVAEEVPVVCGPNTKRPDVVLYLNGIAVGVLELKRSTVSVHEGIRQHWDNQQPHFIEDFFAPVQLLLAGNDTEGLRYGTTGTPEKHYLEWQEDPAPGSQNSGPTTLLQNTEEPNDSLPQGSPSPLERGLGGEDARPNTPTTPPLLDTQLRQLCAKPRLLTLLHDFVVFDRGQKKLCRPNQFFGVQAARQYIARREGGIIWHTQGSGKSLTMVWLTKALLEADPTARVLIVTDRDELDEQIEKVFLGVEEKIHRTTSGADLVRHLHQTAPRLLCSLVHKFANRSETQAYDEYIQEILRAAGQTAAFRPNGTLYVFVDECHRTQSGDLHRAMKQLLPDALFIGFTGTPLLRTTRATTLATFGRFIHTYRVDQAVRDGVVLELRYEARDVDQYISNPKKIDDWFDLKTQGLNDYGRAKLKERWGTMQKVLSSKDRMERIVADIMVDMSTRQRLQNGHGNALLVSGSIYQACRYYEFFQRAGFPQCAIITSYQPTPADTKGEHTGEGTLTERLLKYEIYTKMLGGKSVAEFEQEAKRQFIEEPAQMKLLIVVDKLLTGFDAPSATYLYIDKEMRDHNLFQAICRVNRLDGADKEYGYIVDYKNLFDDLRQAISDYTTGAFDEFDADDIKGLVSNRLTQGRHDLDFLLDQIRLLCEPVEPPRDQPAFQVFFCGHSATPDELKEREPRRRELYKYVASLIRAFADLASDLPAAGYTPAQATQLEAQVRTYTALRDEVKVRAGEAPDLKRFEADMRFLLDAYVRAEEPERVAELQDLGLVALIVQQGPAAAIDTLPAGIRTSPEAVAETIENNVRRLIIDENQTNPKYFGRMSELLDELIERRRQAAFDYATYLAEIAELGRQVQNPGASQHYPATLTTSGQRALYDNLDRDEPLTLALDKALVYGRSDGWRGHLIKEKQVRNLIREQLPNPADTDRILDIVKRQGEY